MNPLTTSRRSTRLFAPAVVAAAVALSLSVAARQGAGPNPAALDTGGMREWLAYLASDELQGRELYTEGLGMAASFIARHLQEWGVKPAAEGGGYFQTVPVTHGSHDGRSGVIVSVNGHSRVFPDGGGMTLSADAGPRRRIQVTDLRFVGYGGLDAGDAGSGEPVDPGDRPVVVWMGMRGAAASPPSARAQAARTRAAVERGASAVIVPAGAAGDIDRRASVSAAKAPRSAGSVTAQRLDRPRPPTIEAHDDFLDFLFSASATPYRELKALADRQQPLPRFALANVTVTIDLESDSPVVATRLSRNVVGIIEGTDPELKSSYVAFGAHYDHIGYQETPPSSPGLAADPNGCVGQQRPRPRRDDVVNNGADDDGSGAVALMAIARAFAKGPRPRRSLVFVWHTGEESGLQGSRYNADYPVVPNERIIAHLNVDMIGRNRCDRASEGNTVYLIGSDRISTELHNVSEDANASLPAPLTIDYELNDPADPQGLYTRSDHYSYAAKGIPVIFYTTGLHRDYHYLTDEIDKIEWGKLARVTQLVYTTAYRLANLDRAPARDNKGPRMGKGSRGRIE